MVVLLWRGARGMGTASELDIRFKRRIWRICLAALAMGFVLWITSAVMTPFLFAQTLRYPALAVLISIGIASYFSIGQVLGAFQLSEFRRALKK